MADIGIYREILLRLPAVSLFRLRAVCKGWCSVIDDPCFIKAHTNHQQLSSNYKNTTFIIRNTTGPPFCPLYYIDLQDLNFSNGLQTIPVTPLKLTRRGLSCLKAFPVAACNGLILIAPLSTKEYDVYGRDNEMNWDPKGSWEIMNPLTHERLKLPRPNIKSKKVVGVGLGYDCAADDYKVVVIDYNPGNYYYRPRRQTHVYSLRSDAWKKIGHHPFHDYQGGRDIQHGVFLNGSLHWVSDDRIFMFDVGTERCNQLPLPDFESRPKSLQLDALSGCLFLSYKRWLDLWVMKDNGRKKTWIKLFSSKQIRNSLRPIAYMKNKGKILLEGYKNEFDWFDVESETLKRIYIHGISGDCSAQVCVGTLFRLHDSCGRRVAPASKRRASKANVSCRLTFCVRDYNGEYNNPPHGNCYPNRYLSSDSESIKVCGTSFDPDGDSSTLSSDMCHEIFLRFPAKPVIQFRAVCKDWKAVIDDPCFVKVHTNKQLVSNNTNSILVHNTTGPPFYPLYSFNWDELDFTEALQTITVTPHEFTGSKFPCLPVAGCNGLMLIDNDEKLELWNPLTDEHLELPQVQEFNSNPSKRVVTGLGYEQATNDYKVVVVRWERKEELYRTHVYSLRSDSWKIIAGDCWCGDDYYRPNGHGVFLCGALHWFSEWGRKSKILAFNLRTESYQQLQGPLLGRGRDLVDEHRCLDVLGGCLIVTDHGLSNDYGDFYDVWMMKDYGSEVSWFKLCTIVEEEQDFCCFPETLRPLTYMKNNTQILLQDEKRFYLFDIESELEKKVICIHGLTGDLTSQVFAGSIFRLHDNCGVSGKRRKRKRKSNMKSPADTELYFCVSDADPDFHVFEGSHDDCYTVDSNWYCSSSENED